MAKDESFSELIVQIEILLLASGRPLGVKRLSELLEEEHSNDQIEKGLEILKSNLENDNKPYELNRVAGGWRLETNTKYAYLVQRLYKQREERGLTPATMETLSVIAYRQPLMRAEIEAIRGVACGEVLRNLLDRRLVKVAGRAEAPGRPMLYGTGPEFLRVFGLSSLEELPEVEGLSIKK
tara:strand:+ start:229 stop:771 length:543 start_codon:yes stop_codon:yes gene_type:complete